MFFDIHTVPAALQRYAGVWLAALLLVMAGACQAQLESALASRFFTVQIQPTADTLSAPTLFFDNQDRFVVRGAPLSRVIAFAFEVQEFQLVDGPDWMYQPWVYDITATPPPAFVDASPGSMVQHLLQTRFGLQLAAQQRLMPAWVLEPDPDNPVLQEVPAPEAPRLNFRMEREAPGIRRLFGTHTLAGLAQRLSGLFSMPVETTVSDPRYFAIDLSGLVPNDPDTFVKGLQQAGLRFTLQQKEQPVWVVRAVQAPAIDSQAAPALIVP